MATHDQARKSYDKRYRKLLLEREKTIHALTKERDELSARLDVERAKRIAANGSGKVLRALNDDIRERADVDDWMIAVYDDECRELRRVVELMTAGFGACDVCEHHISFVQECEEGGCEECQKDCPCRDCVAGDHVKLMEEYR